MEMLATGEAASKHLVTMSPPCTCNPHVEMESVVEMLTTGGAHVNTPSVPISVDDITEVYLKRHFPQLPSLRLLIVESKRRDGGPFGE